MSTIYPALLEAIRKVFILHKHECKIQHSMSVYMSVHECVRDEGIFMINPKLNYEHESKAASKKNALDII